jgi:hypothetical protein
MSKLTLSRQSPELIKYTTIITSLQNEKMMKVHKKLSTERMSQNNRLASYLTETELL